MTKTISIPAKYEQMVGKSFTLKDAIRGKEKGHTEKMLLLDVRFGSAQIYDFEKQQFVHPTIEFKVKPKGFKRAVWTLGFPCKEITFEPEKLESEA